VVGGVGFGLWGCGRGGAGPPPPPQPPHPPNPNPQSPMNFEMNNLFIMLLIIIPFLKIN